MLKIAICDDESYIITQIQEMLYEITKEKRITIETVIFTDGLELEKNILIGEKYDLIYLDIEMKTENGIDAARAIREKDPSVLIIYVSAYTEYIEELLEVETFRFVHKPINRAQFKEYFYKAYEKIVKYAQNFEFQFRNAAFRIPIGNILYFASEGRAITVVFGDGKRERFNGKLNDVENTLKNNKVDFLRIHQSFLVSFRYIKKMTRKSITLQNGEELPISEDRQKEIKQKYCLLLGGEASD